MTFDDVRALLLRLPGTREGTSYGTPAVHVGRKLLVRLREDGDTLVVKLDNLDEQEMLLERDPEVFYLTDHYRGWPSILVRLSRATPDLLAPLLRQAWRRNAPKRLRDAEPEA
jgi:hypothetical protein